MLLLVFLARWAFIASKVKVDCSALQGHSATNSAYRLAMSVLQDMLAHLDPGLRYVA